MGKKIAFGIIGAGMGCLVALPVALAGAGNAALAAGAVAGLGVAIFMIRRLGP